jgi:hypothetical protein
MEEVLVDSCTGSEVGARASIARNVFGTVPVRVPCMYSHS